MKTHLLDTGVLSAYLLNRQRVVTLLEPLILQDAVATSILVYGEIDQYHKSKLAGSRAIPLASSYGDESAVAVATPYLLLTAFYLW